MIRILRVSEAIERMNDRDRDGKRLPFGLLWLTCSLSRRTGGQWKQEEQLELVPLSDDMKEKGMINVRRYHTNERPIAIHKYLIFAIRPYGEDEYTEVA